MTDEMTLQDRAIESDKEVIRLASLLEEATMILADLETEIGLMMPPALLERIEKWRGKESGSHRRGAGRIGRFVQPDPEKGTVNVGSAGHVSNMRGRLARMKHVRVWLKELGGKNRSTGQHRNGTDHSSVPGLVFPHEKTVAAHTAGRKP